MGVLGKKFLIIGDVHGMDSWKEIVDDKSTYFYHKVFIGDYVDSFSIKPVEILFNLKEIIAYKKKNPDKVTLLLGNHDWAYIYDEPGISGFQPAVWHQYKELFRENIDLFDVAYGYRNSRTQEYTLFTHAGLTYKFWMDHISPLINDESGVWHDLVDVNDDLHDILNKFKGDKILWKVGNMRGGFGTPGPLWADYLELLEDPYPDIHQVFGHTAAGTVNVTNIDGMMLAKVDGWYNKKLAHLSLTL